jgi:hypothetical protein
MRLARQHQVCVDPLFRKIDAAYRSRMSAPSSPGGGLARGRLACPPLDQLLPDPAAKIHDDK